MEAFEGLNWFQHMKEKFKKDQKGIQQRIERLGGALQNMNEDE